MLLCQHISTINIILYAESAPPPPRPPTGAEGTINILVIAAYCVLLSILVVETNDFLFLFLFFFFISLFIVFSCFYLFISFFIFIFVVLFLFFISFLFFFFLCSFLFLVVETNNICIYICSASAMASDGSGTLQAPAKRICR